MLFWPMRSIEKVCGVYLLISAEAGWAGKYLFGQLLPQEGLGYLIRLFGHIYVRKSLGVNALCDEHVSMSAVS